MNQVLLHNYSNSVKYRGGGLSQAIPCSRATYYEVLSMRDREALVVQDDDIDSTRKRESNGSQERLHIR